MCLGARELDVELIRPRSCRPGTPWVARGGRRYTFNGFPVRFANGHTVIKLDLPDVRSGATDPRACSCTLRGWTSSATSSCCGRPVRRWPMQRPPPGWTPRCRRARAGACVDLLGPFGMVHRWAATIVRERAADRRRRSDQPGATRLDGWVRDGHAALVVVLEARAGRPGVLDVPAEPVAAKFWCRRQSHETAIHRVDAGLALGETVAFDADLAADGLDELLGGFLPRPSASSTADRAHRRRARDRR